MSEQVKPEDMGKGGGLRYNTGKLRYDLLHPTAQEGIVRVLTKGAEKYAPRNWERGMNWSTVIASMKRHIAAIEAGEDYDPETGELHIDHVQCNAHFLSAYYKIYPQGDDRAHGYLYRPAVGLDIDEVIADWVQAYMDKYGLEERPVFWNFDKEIGEKFRQLKEDKDFWLGVPPKIDPNSLPFEPTCYITSRPIPTEWTEEWLQKNGFPARPIYTVGVDMSKLEAAKDAGIDIFVDDRYENFVELNRAGICTYLMDAPHNQRYDVGHKRIKNLKELL
jgi:uncharacterized HAD superfamily protein